MRIDLVYNPVAGSFREARLEQLVDAVAAHGFQAVLQATTREGVSLSGASDLVCVHGGDGTLRATVAAMGEDAGSVPIAIAPSGTINLVARELGYAKKPKLLASQIAAAWARGEDSWRRSPLFHLDETPVVSCLSVGPDSVTVANLSEPLKKRIGRYAYVVAAMRQLVKWPRAAIPIVGELADGTPFKTEAEAVILSRGALYAGPFRLSPAAGLESETVELVTLRRAGRARFLGFGSAAALRLPVGRFGLAEIRSVRHAELGQCGLPMQVDGDHVGDCLGTVAPSGMALRYCV